jgi:hypothetical protein
MAFRKIILDSVPSTQDVLTISTSGIGFSATFIKSNRLDQMAAISFYFDDENQYRIGFEFHEKVGLPDSLIITHSKDSATKRVGATGVINKSRVLKAIQREKDKANRTFEIKIDPISKLFYCDLRPTFEFSVAFSKKSDLPDRATGIYRYRDLKGSILYIGKGVIKDRATSPERRDWGIHTIEYSIIQGDDICYKWESFYIEAFREEFGLLPVFNRVSGRAE